MKKSLLLSAALLATSFAGYAAQHNIYVANLSDWGNDVALYSWGDSEIFGEWPGATPDEVVTLNGVEYNKFTVSGFDGEVAHPIFNNNNNGQQVDLPMITLDKTDYYFATNGIQVHQYDDPANPDINFEAPTTFVYAIDKTGWDNLYVYAWATGQAEVFGGWPGAKFTETETIKGVTYKKAPFLGNGTLTYNLIFNNGAAEQFDGPTAVSGKDLFIEVTADSYTLLEDPSKDYFKVYIEDMTGWDALYLYAYVDGSASILGAWPGTAMTETATVDGTTYKVVSVEATDVEQTFIINDGATNQLDVEGSYAIDRNLYFKATPDGVETGVEAISIDNEDLTPVYFNLQGVRVAEPSTGLYIVRRGSKVAKEIVK